MIWHLRRGTAALSFAGLSSTALGDAGLVALAPALRRLPALEELGLGASPLGNEGLAALVAPPPPADAPTTTTGVLTKLKGLYLSRTQITDAGCATLAAALDSGVLPALRYLNLSGIHPFSAAAKAALRRAGQAGLETIWSGYGDVVMSERYDLHCEVVIPSVPLRAPIPSLDTAIELEQPDCKYSRV